LWIKNRVSPKPSTEKRLLLLKSVLKYLENESARLTRNSERYHLLANII